MYFKIAFTTNKKNGLCCCRGWQDCCFAITVTDENTYILTTDADVRFTHESVEALLDLMARDPTVGAVCGRTHPLGVGPIVWYQIFDYAIGHWFQKVLDVQLFIISFMTQNWLYWLYQFTHFNMSSHIKPSFSQIQDCGKKQWEKG